MFMNFKTWAEAVAWILARHPQPPEFSAAVVHSRPNADEGDPVIRYSRITGNDEDGITVQIIERAARVVSVHASISEAEEAVDHTAGHQETGWYTESPYTSEMEISDNGRTWGGFGHTLKTWWCTTVNSCLHPARVTPCGVFMRPARRETGARKGVPFFLRQGHKEVAWPIALDWWSPHVEGKTCLCTWS